MRSLTDWLTDWRSLDIDGTRVRFVRRPKDSQIILIFLLSSSKTISLSSAAIYVTPFTCLRFSEFYQARYLENSQSLAGPMTKQKCVRGDKHVANTDRPTIFEMNSTPDHIFISERASDLILMKHEVLDSCGTKMSDRGVLITIAGNNGIVGRQCGNVKCSQYFQVDAGKYIFDIFWKRLDWSRTEGMLIGENWLEEQVGYFCLSFVPMTWG